VSFSSKVTVVDRGLGPGLIIRGVILSVFLQVPLENLSLLRLEKRMELLGEVRPFIV
jgi:hypothetical protein